MAGEVLFYYRNGCQLCEELAAVLFRCWPGQAEGMQWCDVDQDTEWNRAYGNQVPVLIVDGETVCALRPDIERLKQYFGAMTNPL